MVAPLHVCFKTKELTQRALWDIYSILLIAQLKIYEATTFPTIPLEYSRYCSQLNANFGNMLDETVQSQLQKTHCAQCVSHTRACVASAPPAGRGTAGAGGRAHVPTARHPAVNETEVGSGKRGLARAQPTCRPHSGRIRAWVDATGRRRASFPTRRRRGAPLTAAARASERGESRGRGEQSIGRNRKLFLS